MSIKTNNYSFTIASYPDTKKRVIEIEMKTITRKSKSQLSRDNKIKRILRSFLRLCKVQWLHGTNSTAMPIIRRTGNKLTATGILLNEHHVAPPCGELAWGIWEGGINLTSLSGVSVANYKASKRYAKANIKKEELSSNFNYELKHLRNLEPIKNISLSFYQASKRYEEEQISNFDNELKHLRNLETIKIMDNGSMVSLLRVIRFGNAVERKEVLDYLQKIKAELKSNNFCVPSKCLEQSTNIVIEEKDLQKEKLQLNEVKKGDLVVVKGPDGTKKTAIVTHDINQWRYQNARPVVVNNKGDSKFVLIDNMFALTQKKQQELEEEGRKIFEEKIQKLITLCEKPSMISAYEAYEHKEKNSPFPIVFGTTRTRHYGYVSSCISHEIAIKGSIELGGTGIDVAFTDEENLERLKNSLKDNPDIDVHPFSAMGLAYDYVNIVEEEESDNKKITKVVRATLKGSLSYARNLYDQRVEEDETLARKLTFPEGWKSY